ncbi:RNA polymerase subunit sigma-54 [Exiguobacterium antarcticum]|uniref:RNA polymerase subunit sigma-54 n=1 Tax=Exiguobacterium antarcticum TaxID=132920 RepID=A0ABT6QXY5_9BACL|nr:RNA polymerase subunit sigma-54 [Exiguobacterium antarcticum]MDI3233551.1 RNA polymerase subunit sigma-54 [Exiguobacterium antarcticum]
MEQRQEQAQRLVMSAAQLFQLSVLEETRAELEQHLYRIIRRARHTKHNGRKTIHPDLEQVADRIDSFENELLKQIRLESVRQEIGYMAEQLIMYLDTDGLLRTTDAELAILLASEESIIRQARQLLQQCEPTGIAARSEAECRLLHAIESEEDQLIDLVTELQAGMSLKQALQGITDVTERQQMKQRINRLPKRPVLPTSTVVTIPEAEVQVMDGQIRIVWYDIPVDASWTDLEEAKSFLSAYERRRKTLEAILDVVTKRQVRWFEGELHLEPLTKKEVAEQTGYHPSTIGRAIANKTVRTAHGTLALENFFVSKTQDGTSSFLVKVRMAKLIQETITPLSDQQIADRLQVEGIQVARRTIAKYRSGLELTRSDITNRREAND